MSDCCLCSNLVSSNPPNSWDKPLFASENFVVIPSLGSLVEGWLLVVPRRHFICMGALPAELVHELEETKVMVARNLRHQYGEVYAFEHGPNMIERPVGCGVDHAHLHLVPLDFDLKSATRSFMPPEAQWKSASWESCQAAFHEGKDYLYLEQPLGTGHIATHTTLGSQIFRRAIATHVGSPQRFNWREYPNVEVISRTIQALSTPA